MVKIRHRSKQRSFERLSWSASGGDTEGQAVVLHFCGSLDPFVIQQNDPFLPEGLHPPEGNPVKHRLSLDQYVTMVTS